MPESTGSTPLYLVACDFCGVPLMFPFRPHHAKRCERCEDPRGVPRIHQQFRHAVIQEEDFRIFDRAAKAWEEDR